MKKWLLEINLSLKNQVTKPWWTLEQRIITYKIARPKRLNMSFQ